MKILSRSGSFWLICLLVGVLFVIEVSAKSLANPSGSPEKYVYLPFVTYSEVLQPSEEAIFRIDPGGGLNGSTFTPGSLVLTNVVSNTQPITRIRIDLSTAIFPDMVFDPNGLAGDTVAKNLQVDSNSAVFAGHSFTDPHDDGFDAFEIAFAGFDPGETFSFSIDVDPTSIKGVGAPGPNESGSVSGIELVGTVVTVYFADGTVVDGQLYPIAGSTSGAEVLVRKGLPAAPTLQLLGGTTPPAVVSEANQTIRITGMPNRPVQLLVVEGGLFTTGVPGGGFDLDAFEANSALTIQEYSGVTNGVGTLDVPITLMRSQAAGGLNYIVAVQENSFGYKGMVSAPVILEYEVP